MDKRFYVYLHRRADSKEVFYVGKGSGRRAWNTQYRSEYWHRVAGKYGVEIEMAAEGLTEADAFALEIELIAHHKARGVRLVNATIGGEGASGAKRSDETRRRLSIAITGIKKRPWTDEERALRALWQTGRKQTPEAIEKTAAASRGLKRSEETRRRMSEALKGKNTGPWSEERKARFAELGGGMRGKFHSEEAKAKMSAAKRGVKRSSPMPEEQRAKIAAAKKAYWAERRAMSATSAQQ